MAGTMIDIPVAGGGEFRGYLTVPEAGSGAGPADRAGDFWDQREPARGRRPLRRGRLRLPRARPLLAHGARRGPGLRRGRLRQGLRLLRALRRGPGASRHRRGAGCAACAARVHRRGRRHGLLPRRQARLPHGLAPRRRCGGLVLRRRHRGGARRIGRYRMPAAHALRRRGFIRAANGRRRRLGPLRGAAGGADTRLSRRRSRLLQPRAERGVSPAVRHGGPFAHHRAAAPRHRPGLRPGIAVGEPPAPRVHGAGYRRDHGHHGGRAVRQPRADHDRRHRGGRAQPLLCRALHPEDAEGHDAHAALPHRRRRPGGGRDDLQLHPQRGDRLDAAGRGTHGQDRERAAGGDRGVFGAASSTTSTSTGIRPRCWCRSACCRRKVCRWRARRRRARPWTRRCRPTRSSPAGRTTARLAAERGP